MRYIERVEISKFRSLGEKETIEVFDFNIFSGGNDSGKSNVLKALNLFFNGESDFNSRYYSENDFNKWYRDNNIRGQRVIEIIITFAKGSYRDKAIVNKGFIAKKIFSFDGGVETSFYELNGKEIPNNTVSYRRANSVISEKVVYIYVPAVRDTKFRESIQRLIESIAQSSDNRFKTQDLKESFLKMEKGIEGQLEGLKDYVNKHMKIDIETKVNFGTLLESMTFETKESIVIKKRGKGEGEIQKVSLRHRGDGIQMQFFAFLLWYVSKYDKKHSYIWGYEEPEIAFEFKRQFVLVDLFKKLFANDAQVFTTTHSPAFAFTESDERTKVYRVSYEQDSKTKRERLISRIYQIEDYVEGLFRQYIDSEGQNNKKNLEHDIWGINIQKVSRMLGQSMDELIGYRHINDEELKQLKDVIKSLKVEKTDLLEKVNESKQKLEELYPENIFICEDANGISLWKHIIFEKLGLDSNKIEVISSKGCSTENVEIAVSHLMKKKNGYNPKIFRQLDRDGFTQTQVDFLENRKTSKQTKLNKYKVKFLPVNEIENIAVLAESYFTNDMLKDFEINNKLNDAINATIKQNLYSAQRLCKTDDEKNLFRGQETTMVRDARTDMLKFFPGKEIKKIKNRFSIDRKIKSTPLDSFPDYIRNYFNEIQSFFE